MTHQLINNEPIQIDVRAILANKNPTLVKWLPNFIINWLERFVHQEKFNRFLKQFNHLSGAHFAKQVIKEMQANVIVNGLRNIPLTGGAIIVSNHPLGGLDGMALLVEASKTRNDVKVLANDILTLIPQFKNEFVAVNKLGSTTKSGLIKIENTYSSGNLVLVFPAGLCSRKINGKIVDLDWQKSFLVKSIQYNLPIIPVFIEGENTKRFYRIANWRKYFGIKFNIEMMTLPDELYKQAGKSISITFGNPISPSLFNKKDALSQAQKIKSFVYQLKSHPNAVFELV